MRPAINRFLSRAAFAALLLAVQWTAAAGAEVTDDRGLRSQWGQAPQRLLGQHQDAFQQQHGPGRDGVGQHAPRVAGVVVGEAGHRPPGLQVAQVLHQQRGVEGVGVVGLAVG